MGRKRHIYRTSAAGGGVVRCGSTGQIHQEETARRGLPARGIRGELRTQHRYNGNEGRPAMKPESGERINVWLVYRDH